VDTPPDRLYKYFAAARDGFLDDWLIRFTQPGGLLPERLRLLGRIDAGEPNPVLLILGVQERQRFAIGDRDDAATTVDRATGRNRWSPEQSTQPSLEQYLFLEVVHRTFGDALELRHGFR